MQRSGAIREQPTATIGDGNLIQECDKTNSAVLRLLMNTQQKIVWQW
ncbi:MAG: hypothetical protein ACLUVD_06100 [Mediterraneibacter faecis]